MIFVTVGDQLPFDRLVQEVDKWAANNRDIEIVAQIGSTKYQPANMSYYQKIEPRQYKKLFKDADCIVAHAGMGTIISSFEYGKPMIVMPRRAEKGEHRNDHQLVTVKQLHRYGHIKVVYDEAKLAVELDCTLKQLEQMESLVQKIGVSEQLIAVLESFIAEDQPC